MVNLDLNIRAVNTEGSEQSYISKNLVDNDLMKINVLLSSANSDKDLINANIVQTNENDPDSPIDN